jgi:hypothetical protein
MIVETTLIVAASLAGAAGDALPDTSFVTIEFELGTQDVFFGDVTGLAFGPEGLLFVADAQSHEIMAFDSAGGLRLSFGGEGDGPGELRDPCCINYLNGSLWVLSRIHRSFVPFSFTSGEAGAGDRLRLGDHFVLRWRPLQAPTENLYALPLRKAPDGRAGRELARPGETSRQWVELPVPPTPDSLGSGPEYHFELPNGRQDYIVYPHPYPPRYILAEAPDGRFARGVTSSYDIGVFALAGEHLWSVKRDVRPVPLSPEERIAARELEDERVAWGRRVGVRYRPVPPPPTKPPLRAVWFDQDGRLWVRHAEPYDEPCSTIDIYSRTGDLEHVVRVPRSIGLNYGATQGNRIAGVVRDELGVEVVVSLAMIPQDRAQSVSAECAGA